MTFGRYPRRVVVTIDLATHSREGARPAQRSAAATHLARLLIKQGVACTWGFADPAGDPLATQLAAEQGQEIALSRPRFASARVGRELAAAAWLAHVSKSRRRAAEAGLTVTTLLAAGGCRKSVCPKSLVAMGFTAVQCTSDQPAESAAVNRTWKTSSIYRAPSATPLIGLERDVLSPVNGRERQPGAAQNAGILAVSIEPSATSSRVELARLEESLAQLNQLQRQGHVVLATVAAAAIAERRQVRKHGAQSILQRAA